MSKSLNKVILLGNLGADPDVRSTPNGGRVATVSLATGRQWKDASGQRQEKTAWHRVIFWNAKNGQQLADIVERYCKKGDKLYVEGAIEYRQYEDKDKQTRYVTEINVKEILLLGGGKGGDGGFESARPAKAASAGKGGDAGFSDFPEAMDGDDDLPF